MNNITFNVAENLPVQTLLADLLPSAHDFKAEICEDDEMYLYSLNNHKENWSKTLVTYFTLGHSIFYTVKQVADWHFNGLEHVQSFLDFACGYGRFTRFLIQAIAPEKVWAADIYRNAVRFQKSYLGVNGIDSASNPADFAVCRPFDCILANSFFSHMPERTFTLWMDNLYRSLDPRGVLMFTVHDESLLPAHISMPPNGLLFSANSESRSLDMEEYGTTYVTEAYVRACLARISQQQACVHRIPKGICGFQDLYIVTKHQSKPIEELKFSHAPRGYVDAVTRTDSNKVYLEGWALDTNQDRLPIEVQVYLNGKLVERRAPFFQRQDVVKHFNDPGTAPCGWYCFLAHDISDDDVLLVKVVNSAGRSMILECADMRYLLANHVPRIDKAIINQRDK